MNPRSIKYAFALASALTLVSTALAQAVPATEPAVPAAPAAEKTAAEDLDEVVTLSPFEVTSEKDIGYAATETLAGTRIRTELKDVGSAITVITKELMSDVGATGNTSLLQYTTNAEVGGVRSSYAGVGNGTSVDEGAVLKSPAGANRVRGLSPADNTRDFFVSDIPWDGFNVDRIDIQRGPNSILFGLGKPAGIVNASIRGAEFRNKGEAQIRYGSYGSARASFDVNQQLIDRQLAVRVDQLWNKEYYRQKPAFSSDRRTALSARFDPKLFNTRNFTTSLRAKFETGDIHANRPRTITPNDRISSWFRDSAVSAANPFGGMGKLVVSNGYDANYESTPIVVGDNKGYMKNADGDYQPWLSQQGNAQQPLYFFDGVSGQLQRIYGGYINNAARTTTGGYTSTSQGIQGLRYSDVFYGIAGLSTYANNRKLEGYQYGQYREQSLTDTSVFDFQNKLIDGPNKGEWEHWNANNVALSNSAFGDRLGMELIVDHQQYRRGGSSLLGWAPSITLDVLGNFQDLQANPNVGRAYVAGSGSGSSYASRRHNVRASLFGELRTADLTDNKFLVKLLGRHRFNGVFNDEKLNYEERSWRLYAASLAWDQYWNNTTASNWPFDDRPPLSMVYLGDSLSSRTSATGANLPGIEKVITLNDGPIYHFESTWKGGSNFGDEWTIPAGSPLLGIFNTTNTLYQNSNPANYVGWNSNRTLDILRYEDGEDSLTTAAGKTERRTRSYAGSWQSYWWRDALVGTLGWRYDIVKSKDVTASNVTANRNMLDLSPTSYRLADTWKSIFKEHSLSWGGVLHLNKILEKDVLPFNVSLSYNRSSNFEVSSTRRNLYGDVLGNPAGQTIDVGLQLSTKDNKYSFRAIKYKSTVKDNSTSMSSLQGFGNIVSYGLRWANVFQYDLGSYTMDTANASNEWRYNFDPDTTINETQEQATARENASVAAWRGIQAALPSKFFNYWEIDPSQVIAYKVWGGTATPAGLTVTSDTESKGYEFELTANPMRSLRLSFNASQTEAVRTNVGGAETKAFVDYMTEQMAGPAGELRMYSGGPTAWTLRQQWNSWLGNWTLLKLQEGAAASEIRKWRYNVIANYSFLKGRLKGLGIGGTYRWQDKVVIGYPVKSVSASEYTFDLDRPYYGPSENAVDLWIGYEHKLTRKINWKIQLNGRNVLGKTGVLPISVQPDGKTWASVRVKPDRDWFLTNTFSF